MNENPSASANASTLNAQAVFERLYDELKRLAHAQRARSGNETINTTAIVHDLYLQLADRTGLEFKGPLQFYAYAAKAMRNLLIDRARARQRQKAGGDVVHVSLDDHDAFNPAEVDSENALHIHDLLEKLSQEDARAAEVVELYLFAGLPIARIAELKGLSTRTVDRDWQFARAYLHAALKN